LFNAFLENPSQFNVTVSAKYYEESKPNSYTLGFYNNSNKTIYLNSKYLDNGFLPTDLGISQTLIHEFLHAYLSTINNVPQHYLSLNFPSLLDSLYLNELKINLNLTQHEWIQNNYLTPFTGALQSLFPNISIEYIIKLAWCGLQETSEFKKLDSKYQEEIIAIWKSENLGPISGNTNAPKGTIIICN
ncbi:MAG: hypothetical protein QM539_05585, partial [Alphaproteobacteria bacterium]|nr:hypothetical protein [Alphaproteobacteria bacterium]